MLLGSALCMSHIQQETHTHLGTYDHLIPLCCRTHLVLLEAKLTPFIVSFFMIPGLQTVINP